MRFEPESACEVLELSFIPSAFFGRKSETGGSRDGNARTYVQRQKNQEMRERDGQDI